MFSKRSKTSSPPQRPNGEASQTEQSGIDPRDETIARLSRELATERESLAALREGLDAAAFKTEVLEKSYAKQLADTRQKLAATEKALNEKQKVLAALDGGHEDALRALNDARAELKLVTAERDQLRRQTAQSGFHRAAPSATRAPVAFQDPTTDAGGTINALIAGAGWSEKPAAVGQGHSTATAAERDAPSEVMLAPELVFTKGRDEDAGGET